jgi:hypothetical protein
VKAIALMLFAGISLFISACRKDDGSANQSPDVNKVLQDAAQKEKKMYEGIQKGMESLEKNVQDQKEGKK